MSHVLSMGAGRGDLLIYSDCRYRQQAMGCADGLRHVSVRTIGGFLFDLLWLGTSLRARGVVRLVPWRRPKSEFVSFNLVYRITLAARVDCCCRAWYHRCA